MKKTIKLTAVLTAVMLLLCSCGSTADLPLRSQTLDKDGFFQGVKALDYVDLCDISSITVSQEDFDALVDEIRAAYPIKNEVYDRPVADGETVNLDYTGYIDGVAFEGGSAQGYEVVIGETVFIDTFIQDIMGHMPGDEFSIYETFPQYYPANEALQNKEARFDIKINYLVDTEMPELTDEYVAANLNADYGWSTVEDMKTGVLQELCYTYVTENSPISEIPEVVVKAQEDSLTAYYQTYADYYAMDIADFLPQYLGVETMDEVIEQSAEYIARSAEQAMYFQAMAEKENLVKIKKSEIRDYYRETTGSGDFTAFRELYGLPYLKQTTRTHKVFGVLTSRATVK